MLAFESVKINDLGAKRIPFFPGNAFPACSNRSTICVVGDDLSKSAIAVLGGLCFMDDKVGERFLCSCGRTCAVSLAWELSGRSTPSLPSPEQLQWSQG